MTEVRIIEDCPNSFLVYFLKFFSYINICFMSFFPLYQIFPKSVETAESNQSFFGVLAC